MRRRYQKSEKLQLSLLPSWDARVVEPWLGLSKSFSDVDCVSCALQGADRRQSTGRLGTGAGAGYRAGSVDGGSVLASW